MKQQYILPEIKVITMKQESYLMAGSLTMSVSSGTKDAGEALSRDYFFEDDEEY